MTSGGPTGGGRRGTAARRAIAGVASLVLTMVALRAFLLLPEHCDRASPEEIDAAVTAAVGWFERNQRPTGRFTYDHDVRAGEDLPGYNLVRHAGVLVSLYQAARGGWDDALAIGDRGLEVALGSLVRHDDWAAFGTRRAPLRTGATSLLAVAVSLRQDLTGDAEHEPLLAELGRFLLAVQGGDGRVHALWDHDTEAPVPGEYSPFFTGETLWALTRLHRAFPDDGWDGAAQRTLRYVTHQRDDVEEWFPPVSDHWVAYALAEMSDGWDGEEPDIDEEAVDWVRRQAGLFGVQVRFESHRTGRGWVGLVRGGPARGGGVGTLGEGLAGLRVFVDRDPRLADIAPAVDDRLHCATDLLVRRQVGAAEALETSSPEVAAGAWLHRGATRMDDQQHAVSALLLAREAFHGPGDVRDRAASKEGMDGG